MILDASFLIDLLRTKDGPAQRKAAELDAQFAGREVSSITVMELWRGVEKSSSTEREAKKVELVRWLIPTSELQQSPKTILSLPPLPLIFV